MPYVHDGILPPLAHTGVREHPKQLYEAGSPDIRNQVVLATTGTFGSPALCWRGHGDMGRPFKTLAHHFCSRMLAKILFYRASGLSTEFA